MHIDLFKCTISESIGQRRQDAWPLYRFHIKYHFDLYQMETFSWSNLDNAFSFDLISYYFFSCTVLVSVHLSICELEICSSICQKNTFQNDFVLEFRKSPTFNLKQL